MTQPPLPTVWRIHIKTCAEAGIDPRQFCLDQSCLGVGWPVGHSETLEWPEYEAQAKGAYRNDKSWKPALTAVRSRMQDNDLCWTRDTKGIYYLGRIAGPWKYVARPENLRADIVNIRTCEWVKVGLVDSVPGKVVSSFRPNRTVQVVDDETVRVFSAYFYNRNTSSEFQYSLPEVPPDIFALLSAEDCEDLVGLYMQANGYFLIASSCKLATMAYEFVMRHRESGEWAVAQVKNGFEDISIEEYGGFQGRVFLFTSNGRYTGSPASNVRCLSRDEIKAFIQANEPILPSRVLVWLAIAKELSGAPEKT